MGFCIGFAHAHWAKSAALFEESTGAFNVALAVAAREVCDWARSLQAMRRHRLEPDSVTFNTVMKVTKSASGNLKDFWSCGLDLLVQMACAGVPSNESSYSALLSSEWQLGLVLWTQMHRVHVTAVGYSAVIAGLEKAARWQAALRFAATSDVALDVVALSACVSACEKASEWQQALCLLESSQDRRVIRDVILYNAAASALEKGSAWALALHLLRCMSLESLTPDEMTYSALISACEWRDALALLNQATAADAADAACCNAALSACSRCSQWQLALVLLQQLEAKGTATETSYNAAIGACYAELKAKASKVMKGSKDWWLRFTLLPFMAPWPSLRCAPRSGRCGPGLARRRVNPPSTGSLRPWRT